MSQTQFTATTSYFSQLAPDLLNKGYEPIPIASGKKCPAVKGWNKVNITPDQIKKWIANGHANAGVGIRTAKTPAIDIDVRDEEIVKRTIALVNEVLEVSHPLSRIGLPPKTLMPCRTDRTFPKKTSRKYRSPDGLEHKLEILADGQQFVGYGIHPDTAKQYEWSGSRNLVELRLEDLPLLTEAMANEMIRRFESEVVPRDWDIVTQGTSQNNSPGMTDPEADDPFANLCTMGNFIIKDLEDDLAVLDSRMGRSDWIKVGMGIYYQFAGTRDEEKAKWLYKKWSINKANYQPGEIDKIWQGFKHDNKINPVTYSTVRKMANEARTTQEQHANLPEVITDEDLNKFFPPFVNLSDTTPVELPLPIIEKIVPAGEATLFAGHGGAGKSYVALVMAIMVALGWNFGPLHTNQGNVLYYSAEDSADILRYRVSKICRILNIDQKELAGKLFLLDVSNINPALSDDKGNLIKTVRMLEFFVKKNNIILTIIDNASDTYNGNEIDRQQVRTFIRGLRTLIARPDRGLVVLAHISKAAASNKKNPIENDYSGSTAWHNSCRSRLSLHDQNGTTILQHLKANHGEKAKDIEIGWSNGVPLPAGTVDNIVDDFFGNGESSLAAKTEQDKKAIYLVILDLNKLGEHVPAAMQGPHTAYKYIKDHDGYPPSVRKADCDKYIRELIREGLLIKVIIKTNQRKEKEVLKANEATNR